MLLYCLFAHLRLVSIEEVLVELTVLSCALTLLIAHLRLMSIEVLVELTVLSCALLLLLQGHIGNRGPPGPPGLKGAQVWRK